MALGSASVFAQTQPAPAQTVPQDEITVTATKDQERAIDALASVNVVNRTEIRQLQAQRIGSILNQLPNVETNENQRDPATAINIRGLQDFGRVAVTVDGARQNFQTSGHNANGVFYLDPAFLKSIDITRGPVANVYGSGAIGGVVSFETVDPRDILLPGERFATELGATGVFGRQSGLYASALAALRANEILETMAGVSYKRLGDYKDGDGNSVRDTGQDLRSAIGKIVINPGNGHQLKLSGQYQKYDFAAFGTGDSSSIRRQTELTTTTATAKYTFSQPDNPWVNLSANAYITSTDERQFRLTGTAATLFQPRSFTITTSGFDINNTSRFQFGEALLSVTYGGDYFQDKVTTKDNAGSADKFTPSGMRTVYGGFVQGHLKWRMIDVIAAGRYDGYELSGNGNSSDGSRFSPKITVGVTPITGIQFYGTYAEGYRAPSTTETLISGTHPAPADFVFIPNPNLRPEIGHTLEGGVNVKYDDLFMAGDKLRAKATVFRNDVDDYIDGVQSFGPLCGAPIPNACKGSFYTYMNKSNARITGAEGEVAYDARRWFFSLAGAVTRGDADDATTGKRAPLSSIYPSKIVVGGGVRFFDEKLLLGARVSFVGAQNRVPTGFTPSKEFQLVDLYGSYQFTPDTRAFFQVDNLGDVRYKRYRDTEYSPGIVAKVGFSTRFGS
ncbi:TonB-dependent hemoglobin/transferrin/lactoferrin family receptor [Terrarubrum flagellatum]|uniref:TonB-dependent hemoglobin/transferrin/lactoferrin family receptor n=1 Tax=Terrirubrum flagellatum TaxID=2895980 RepID=UPI0031450C16